MQQKITRAQHDMLKRVRDTGDPFHKIKKCAQQSQQHLFRELRRLGYIAEKGWNHFHVTPEGEKIMRETPDNKMLPKAPENKAIEAAPENKELPAATYAACNWPDCGFDTNGSRPHDACREECK